jgi:hypothetical protein
VEVRGHEIRDSSSNDISCKQDTIVGIDGSVSLLFRRKNYMKCIMGGVCFLREKGRDDDLFHGVMTVRVVVKGKGENIIKKIPDVCLISGRGVILDMHNGVFG